jgi:hypothetical protein
MWKSPRVIKMLVNPEVPPWGVWLTLNLNDTLKNKIFQKFFLAKLSNSCKNTVFQIWLFKVILDFNLDIFKCDPRTKDGPTRGLILEPFRYGLTSISTGLQHLECLIWLFKVILDLDLDIFKCDPRTKDGPLRGLILEPFRYGLTSLSTGLQRLESCLLLKYFI